MAEKPEDLRTRADAIIDEVVTDDALRQLLEGLLDLQKKQSTFCPNCRKMVYVEVKDYPKIIAGLKDLMAEAKGRPAVAEGEHSGVTLLVKGWWADGDNGDSEPLPPAA